MALRAAKVSSGRVRGEPRGAQSMVGLRTQTDATAWTPEQHAALEMLADPFTKYSREDIAERIGIRRAETISEWKQLPGWAQEQMRRTARYLAPVFRESISRAMSILKNGDDRAAASIIKSTWQAVGMIQEGMGAESGGACAAVFVQIVGPDGRDSSHYILATQGAESLPPVSGPLPADSGWDALWKDNGRGNGASEACDWGAIRDWLGLDS